jgi:ATP-GRASP peptide maturase of grasp-with-spasm system
MILIFSSHLGEFTTDLVIDWLDFNKINYKRINGVDLIRGDLKIDFNSIEISLKNEIINFSDVSTFWFRRLLPYNYFLAEYGALSGNKILNIELIRNIQSEYNRIRDFISVFYKEKNWLSKIENSSLNKIEVLNNARQLGIMIPDSVITTSKDEIIKFKKKHSGVIVKSISEVLGLPIDNEAYISYTYPLTDSDIDNLPQKFYPSLVQENIEKDYELRIFYLNGAFYSMAIFSQNDEQTKTDFRVYNIKKPNRNVPFSLPKDIEVKLDLLMKMTNLNCGSIDMIRSVNGDYVFLEINPIGQFGMVSKPCNYYLEEKVADILNELDKN